MPGPALRLARARPRREDARPPRAALNEHDPHESALSVHPARPSALVALLDVRAEASRGAAERCADALAAGSRAGRLARCVPRETRLELATGVAWFALADAVGRASGPRLERLHRLALLRNETNAAFDGGATTTIGRALAYVAARRGLEQGAFLGALDALDREQHVCTFETRSVLREHARATAGAAARVALACVGWSSERRALLAENAATAAQMLVWWSDVAGELERGRLWIPVEDLAARGVSPADLRARRFGERDARLVAQLCLWARELLVRGWDLATDLGPLRGRAAAAALRLAHARLRAIERAGFDVVTAARRPRRWRSALALVAGLVRRAPPRDLVRPPERS